MKQAIPFFFGGRGTLGGFSFSLCVYFRGRMRSVIRSLFTLRLGPIPSLCHGPQTWERTNYSQQSAGTVHWVQVTLRGSSLYGGSGSDWRVEGLLLRLSFAPCEHVWFWAEEGGDAPVGRSSYMRQCRGNAPFQSAE